MTSSPGKPSPSRGRTISVPADQVTKPPIPGYTTKDFWRDLEASQLAARSRTDEFARSHDLAGRLAQVPNSEVDERG
jgi:hypothetical protein